MPPLISMTMMINNSRTRPLLFPPTRMRARTFFNHKAHHAMKSFCLTTSFSKKPLPRCSNYGHCHSINWSKLHHQGQHAVSCQHSPTWSLFSPAHHYNIGKRGCPLPPDWLPCHHWTPKPPKNHRPYLTSWRNNPRPSAPWWQCPKSSLHLWPILKVH